MNNNILSIALIGMIMGVLGTAIGGFIGCLMKNTSNKISSIFLQLSAGIMTAVVCFDLIPEGAIYAGIKVTLIGFVLGVICLIAIEDIIIRIQKKLDKENANSKNLMRTGILVFTGIMLHNLPEGLAIGSGFGVSVKMGMALAIVIAFHDIPEGIAVTLPLRRAGTGFIKALGLAALSGFPTGVGALIGALVGGVSDFSLSISLGFAAGAMLYVVSGEIIPESRDLYRGRVTAFAYIIGFISGIIVINL